MTTGDSEPGLEVAVTTVGPRRRDRRRATIVGVAVGLGILVREPRTTAQLVLVRRSDLDATALRIESGADDIVGLGWAP